PPRACAARDTAAQSRPHPQWRAAEERPLRHQRGGGKPRPERAYPPSAPQARKPHPRDGARPGLPPRRCRGVRIVSLRLRLTLILGSAFLLLWTLTATWLLFDLRNQTMLALDQRLAASARMVAGLVAQLPPELLNGLHEQRLSAEQLGIPNGLRCQVASLRGTVLARSHPALNMALPTEHKGYGAQTIDGRVWRSYTLISDNGLRITTADPVEERSQLERSIWLSATVPDLVALLGSLGILALGVRKGLAPLTRIREALLRRSADDLSPLTVIKTSLQVARMTGGATAEQALANAEQGADRLQRTIEQLLLLARLEGQLPLEDDEPLAAEEIAELAIRDTGDAPIELHP